MTHHSEETITIHGGSVGEIGGIVEKVAQAITTRFKDGIAKSAEMSFQETGVALPNFLVFEAYADAAIRATIEHLKMHISDGMLAASRKTGVPGFYLPTDDSDKFRAMLNTALSDLEES